jgi:hypothetical protein
MSVLTVTRPRLSSAPKPAAPAPPKETGPPRHSRQVESLRADLEPLEAALRDAEAPETWQRSHEEAPDAGRGDPHDIERDFSHGRSRS